jgi:membrane fusion protein PltH
MSSQEATAAPAGQTETRLSSGRARVLLFLGMFVLLAAGATYWMINRTRGPEKLVLHGNVDLRQIDLPFNGDQRIAAVLVQEGDHVHKGETLARLDTRRIVPEVAEAEAQVAAQAAVVDRLHHGTRPEEIAQLRAALESVEADATNARQQYARQSKLMAISGGRAASAQDLDTAKAALDVANAKVVAAKKALDLAVIGPRKEDVAQGEAQLRASEARLAFLRQSLADADLIAPADAVVRVRLMEAGEMASPQRPVFSLAIVDPKWVRAYVPEPDLGKIHMGEAAAVDIDSFPGRKFEGWIGFISPIAEFTPKSVETTDLRTSLVYEIRVFVKDPFDVLPLGAPATVHLQPGSAPGRSSSG